MNLLFHIKNLRAGGAQRHLILLANYFVELGHRVSILAINDYPKPEFYIDSRIKVFYLRKMFENKDEYFNASNLFSSNKEAIYKLQRKVIQYTYKGESRKIKRKNLDKEHDIYRFFRYIVINENIDICLSFMSDSSKIVYESIKGTRCKHCIVQMSFPDDNQVQQYGLRKIYQEADLCVFQTQEQMDYYGYENGVVIFNPLLKAYPVKKSNSEKVVVNFCRFCKAKNLPLLLEAFGQFSAIHPEYSLFLYGDDDENMTEALYNYAESEGFADKVHILPSEQNIHDIIVSYSMFVTSSDWEGISNSMIEAMACGLPTIATDCIGGGARAIIEDHVNGILVPRGDSNTLCKAMCEIAENDILSENLSKNALKINETLSKERIVGKWLKELEKISQ